MNTHGTGAGRLPYLIVLGLAFAVVLGMPMVLHVPEKAAPLHADLTILSVHPDTVRTEFARAFSDWMVQTHGRAVTINWLDMGGTSQATKALLDMFKQTPDGVGIDLFFGGGVDPYLELARRGLLEPIDVPADILDRIPQSFNGMDIYDRQHRWFGAALSGFGIIFNRDVLERMHIPEPKEWADLGRSSYFTWVASADPRQSGSMHAMYEVILQAYGWQKGWQVVASLGANCRGFTNQASDVPKDVSTGEAAAGMAIDFYARQAVAEAGGDRLQFRLPPELTVVSPDALGVLKGAPHPKLARLFVQFVLSEEAQKLWILKPGTPGGPREHLLARLSVIPGLTEKYKKDAFVHMDPFKFSGIQLDSALTSRRWRILNDLLGACIIDVQDRLAAAWNAVRRLPPGDPHCGRLTAELFRPFISEKKLMELAGKPWDDPAVRAETISRWSAEASARYERILKEAH